MVILEHMVILCLTFGGNARLHIARPSSSARVPRVAFFLPSLAGRSFFILAMLMSHCVLGFAFP